MARMIQVSLFVMQCKIFSIIHQIAQRKVGPSTVLEKLFQWKSYLWPGFFHTKFHRKKVCNVLVDVSSIYLYYKVVKTTEKT